MADIEKIKAALTQRGYNPKKAESVAANLARLSPELMPALEAWLADGTETPVQSHDISSADLMSRFGMNYPAALLSVDWVMREPDKAIPIIKKGIR